MFHAPLLTCPPATFEARLSGMNLATAFTQTALQRPQKTALFWGEQEFTYTVLHDQSLAVARQLVEKFEVKPGDRVALWLKNRPEFIPAFFGIVNAGAVVVPINNFLKPAEVNYIVSDSGADLLITDDELGGHHPELAAARPTLKMLKVEEFSAEGRGAGSEDKGLKMEDGKNPPSSILHSPASSPKESDLAVIIYTSGTTGRPKGAMLSHGNLLHNVESCRLVLESVHEDRVAVLLPLFHTYMLTVGMLLPLIVGGSMVLVRSLSQPHHILKEIISRQATILLSQTSKRNARVMQVSAASAALDRQVMPGRGAAVQRERPDEDVVLHLFQHRDGPAGHAAGREDRHEEVFLDAVQVVDHARIEIDVHVHAVARVGLHRLEQTVILTEQARVRA